MIIGKRSSSSKEKETEKKARKSTHHAPKVDDYVALKCEKYKEFLPQIGRLTEINETNITIEWLDGSYTGTWVYWKTRGKVITEDFPRRAIMQTIQLTPAMKIRKDDILKLKDAYTTAEFV